MPQIIFPFFHTGIMYLKITEIILISADLLKIVFRLKISVNRYSRTSEGSA